MAYGGYSQKNVELTFIHGLTLPFVPVESYPLTANLHLSLRGKISAPNGVEGQCVIILMFGASGSVPCYMKTKVDPSKYNTTISVGEKTVNLAQYLERTLIISAVSRNVAQSIPYKHISAQDTYSLCASLEANDKAKAYAQFFFEILRKTHQGKIHIQSADEQFLWQALHKEMQSILATELANLEFSYEEYNVVFNSAQSQRSVRARKFPNCTQLKRVPLPVTPTASGLASRTSTHSSAASVPRDPLSLPPTSSVQVLRSADRVLLPSAVGAVPPPPPTHRPTPISMAAAAASASSSDEESAQQHLTHYSVVTPRRTRKPSETFPFPAAASAATAVEGVYSSPSAFDLYTIGMSPGFNVGSEDEQSDDAAYEGMRRGGSSTPIYDNAPGGLAPASPPGSPTLLPSRPQQPLLTLAAMGGADQPIYSNAEVTGIQSRPPAFLPRSAAPDPRQLTIGVLNKMDLTQVSIMRRESRKSKQPGSGSVVTPHLYETEEEMRRRHSPSIAAAASSAGAPLYMAMAAAGGGVGTQEEGYVDPATLHIPEPALPAKQPKPPSSVYTSFHQPQPRHEPTNSALIQPISDMIFWYNTRDAKWRQANYNYFLDLLAALKFDPTKPSSHFKLTYRELFNKWTRNLPEDSRSIMADCINHIETIIFSGNKGNYPITASDNANRFITRFILEERTERRRFQVLTQQLGMTVRGKDDIDPLPLLIKLFAIQPAQWQKVNEEMFISLLEALVADECKSCRTAMQEWKRANAAYILTEQWGDVMRQAMTALERDPSMEFTLTAYGDIEQMQQLVADFIEDRKAQREFRESSMRRKQGKS